MLSVQNSKEKEDKYGADYSWVNQAKLVSLYIETHRGRGKLKHRSGDFGASIEEFRLSKSSLDKLGYSLIAANAKNN